MELLSTAFGSFKLQRLPVIKNDSLRAWDAADELLLHHVSTEVADQSLVPGEKKILLVNDQFGALAISLNDYSPHSWSDSYQSHLATQNNILLNELSDQVNYLPGTEMPEGSFDLVLIKVPKTLALLHDQLIKLKAHITAGTRIVATGMVRHIHSSTLALFEEILGATKTSLATKKARLIFPSVENKPREESPFPTSFYDASWDIKLSNHANVFAKDKLDIGARLMLEQFKQLPDAKHIVDLGCGNGVLGIIAKRLQADSKLTFIDESYMAVASAKQNYMSAFDNDNAEFMVNDGLTGLHTKDIDLILCNPPFHQQHAMSDHVAWQMFKQSRQQLQQGGELWVVGNRNLGYHQKLKRLFGNYRNIAGNKRFAVLAAKK